VKETAFESLPLHVVEDVVSVVPPMVLVVVPFFGGLSTRIWKVPACAMLVAGTVACNCWLLTKVAVKEEPLKSTSESLINPLPLMVNTSWLAPAVALVGEIEVMDGEGWQEQETVVASAITSTHKPEDLVAVFIRFSVV
jgi:hypothetical protein